jgi:hypothetical protein
MIPMVDAFGAPIKFSSSNNHLFKFRLGLMQTLQKPLNGLMMFL